MSFINPAASAKKAANSTLVIGHRHSWDKSRVFFKFFYAPALKQEKKEELAVEGFVLIYKKLPGFFIPDEETACLFHLFTNSMQGQIGRIRYRLLEGTATSSYYEPKENARFISGLGYYLEAVAVNILREEHGISFVRTTDLPAPPRIRQLEFAGLGIREKTPIEKWIRGLAKGIMHVAGKAKRAEKIPRKEEPGTFQDYLYLFGGGGQDSANQTS